MKTKAEIEAEIALYERERDASLTDGWAAHCEACITALRWVLGEKGAGDASDK